MNRDKIKKLSIILILAMFSAAVMEVVSWIGMPTRQELVMPSETQPLYPEIEPYVVGYDISENTFSSTTNDPQLGFVLPEREIQTVIVEFEEPLAEDTLIQVYYAIPGEDLCEPNHVEVIAEVGSLTESLDLALSSYSHIRVDINGDFDLKSISTSALEPVIEEIPVIPDYSGMLMRGVSFFAAILMYFGAYRIVEVAYRKMGWREELAQKTDILFQKYKIGIFIGIIVLFVFVKLNNSSVLCYSAFLANNLGATDLKTIGIPRGIRGDEFAVDLPLFFHETASEKLNALLAGNGSIFEWISDVIAIINPFYWGRFCLSNEYGLSWQFVFGYAVAFYSFFRLLKIITENSKFAVIGSVLLIFSPSMQWWWGPEKLGIIFGFVVFFYDFFEADTTWKKIFCSYALICLTSKLIPGIYPAWDIPYAYLAVVILIGIYATKRKIHFEKSDIPYIVIVCTLMLIIILAYFIGQSEVNNAMLATVYPGKRFSMGGGLSSRYWADYLAMPFNTWKTFLIPGTNESEMSSALHLFPLPFIVYVLKYKDFKHNKVMTGIFAYCLCCVWYMVFGVGEFLARYTLLSYTTTERLFTVFGITSLLLLLLECYYIVPAIKNQLSAGTVLKVFVLNATVVSFLIWVVVNQRDLVSHIGGELFEYAAIVLVLLANLLYFGAKREFISILCMLTIISGITVNPINFGMNALTETPIAKVVQAIDAREPGRWITLNDRYLSKYIYAQGVDCLNWLSWPPRFDLFQVVDEDDEFVDVYNRYAHVTVGLNQEDTTFELLYADAIHVNLNVNDLEKWDVKYIVTQHQPLEQFSENVVFELLYHDTLDNIYLYKVIYNI